MTLAFLPANAWAQVAGSPIDPLKRKATLTVEEGGQIKVWLDERLRLVAAEDAVSATQALKAIREAASGGSAAFNDALAAGLVELSRPMLARAEAGPSVRLVAALTLADSAAAASVLVAALKDERPAVRAAAAAGLRRLQPRIAAAGAATFGDVVSGLATAAKNETSAPALAALYTALDFNGVSANVNQREVANALLGVLEARQPAYEDDSVAAPTADVVAVRLLGSAQLDPGASTRFGVVLGKMLRYAIQAYTTSLVEGEPALINVSDDADKTLVDRRNGIEQLVFEIEKQLNTLVGASPDRNLAEKMRRANDTDIKIAMQAWAGALKAKYAEDFTLKQVSR